MIDIDETSEGLVRMCPKTWPWSIHKDARGRTFYFHERLGWSAWRVPVSVTQADTSPWWKVTSTDGSTYYFRKDTRERRWNVSNEDVKDGIATEKEFLPVSGEKEALERDQEELSNIEMDPDAYESSEQEEDSETFERSTSRVPLEGIDPTRRAGTSQEDRAVEIKESFHDLLREAKVTRFSFWKKVEKQIALDPRFQALEKSERVKAFDSYLASLINSDAAHASSRETKRSKSEAEVKRDAANFRRMLREFWVSSGSKWSSWQDELRSDPRYIAIEDELERQRLFSEFAKECEESQRRVQEKEKRRLVEMERERREAARKLRRIQHQSAISAFGTLLAEEVKDPSAKWEKWRSILAVDLQKRTEGVDLQEQEEMFRAHVQELCRKAEASFKDLLDETIPPWKKSSTDWEAFSARMAQDRRFQCCPSKLREKLFQEHMLNTQK